LPDLRKIWWNPGKPGFRGGGEQAARAEKPHGAKQNPPRDLIAAPFSEQDKLRLSLMRKLMPFVNSSRACRMAACRRHRRCASANFECRARPARSFSPESEQAALASLQRALARRRAELKLNGEA
jgi:hypothetical protein